ncbi:hypothetical protein GCK72_023294 [Caenorhabditis remanei]|uniref:Uncharacterized protein n=1 Tax=Caenorhabditis remanei TaxID=31234 RepID=A0A6A5FW59_CAERE|nr:hypothetical protein GCK72_023294 [Caenorhabditis remanei]KAF1746836.1 hypothetical protein GCK72_023294 [Caenorhabditis remanei]
MYLSRETKAGGDPTHRHRDKMIQISVCRCSKLEGTEADVIQGFVVDAECLIRIFNKLMDGECGVVWLNDSVRHFWTRDHREGVHDTIRIFLTDFGDQKCSHSRTSTSSQREILHFFDNITCHG